MSKTALILGGTKGLGFALAIECLKNGIKPTIVGRNISHAVDNLELCCVEFRQADITNHADHFKIVKRTDQFDYVFWVAGILMEKPLGLFSSDDTNLMVATHFTGPVAVLGMWHAVASGNLGSDKTPYHLVTIASTSSWKMRENQAIYCALKAAKAHFTRQYAQEIVRDLPGSKITLVNPGGIQTPDFWKDLDRDISKFMKPTRLAQVIMERVLGQEKVFSELQITRDENGEPVVQEGQVAPEAPSF